jgi:Taurine catabolism dioxygenase TauD, TfdA family
MDGRGRVDAVLGLGTYLGEPQPQNRQGDRVYLVTDTGKSLLEARGSKTNTGMIFHTDSSSAFAGSRPDILGLLCLRKAVSGGESLMVSGHTAYNALLETQPELVEELYGSFCFDRSARCRRPWSRIPVRRSSWFLPLTSVPGTPPLLLLEVIRRRGRLGWVAFGGNSPRPRDGGEERTSGLLRNPRSRRRLRRWCRVAVPGERRPGEAYMAGGVRTVSIR